MILDTWTINVDVSVMAGDMSKEEVMARVRILLNGLTDGTDILSINVNDANRDEY